MNKEEILEKARKENKGVDEVKRSAEGKATKIAMAVGIFACMLLNFMDAIIWETDVISFACWIIYGTMVSANLWTQAVCLKKTGYWIGAILTAAFTVLEAVLLIIRL